MKLKIRTLTIAALTGLVLSAHSAQQYIPNGDFETPDGDSWNRNGSEGTVISFPTADGNPGGYGKIDNGSGAWGVLVAEGGTGPSPEMGAVPSTGDGISLTSLGLTAGETYTFNLDMIDFSSDAPMAGMKIESWAGGSALSDSGNQTFATTTSWANYSFNYTINPSATHLKFVPLLVEQGSVAVGFDNVGYDDSPVDVDPAPEGPFIIPNGDFSAGGTGWQNSEGGDEGTPIVVDYDYPATGGNPDGHAVIDFTSGFYALIFSNSFPLSQFGLEAGKTYTFTMDMKNLDGAGAVGKLKLEFDLSATPNNSGDLVPDELVGDGSEWETYGFTYTIPSNATTIKFVPLWGGDNTNVGFDNIGGNNIEADGPPQMSVEIPNGDFEADPLGADWATTETTPTYVDDGTGNPGRFVQLTDGVGPFTVLYAFDGAEVTFSSLGLAPGDAYSIQLDMKIITPGSDPTSPIGGIRLVGPSGFDQTIWPDLIGDGSTWETYTIDLEVPAESNPPIPAQLRIGLRPGNSLSGATVAFDNVTLLTGPAPPAFAAEIKTGTVVTWEPTSMENTYQPQSSEDGTDWMDVGPAITGDSVNSIFAEPTAANYRVEEFEASLSEAILNGSFEEVDPLDDPFSALYWEPNLNFSQPPTRINTDVRTGEWSLQLKVQNNEDPVSNQAEVSHNVLNSGGSITPGATYDFSFYAKQISGQGSYEQRYRLQWLNNVGGIVGSPNPGFTPIVGGDGEWLLNEITGIVAPESAATAFIQFIALTGAVAGVDQEGEVLLDDASLVESSLGSIGFLPTTNVDGVGICWPSEIGKTYQVKSSTSLSMFEDFGPWLDGTGETMVMGDVITPPAKYYQVIETP